MSYSYSYFVSVSFSGSSHPLKDGSFHNVNPALDTTSPSITIISTQKSIEDAIELAEMMGDDAEVEVESTLAGISSRYSLFNTEEEASAAASTATISYGE